MVKLFGILDRSKNDKELIRSMSDSFGFGKADYASFKNLWLGHIRIPSLNRKGIAEDENAIVCFTGELFNDINKKEEEFILESYNESGTRFVEKLNGTFVFLIYDKKNDKLFIINDRYGMRPLYYYSDKEKIVFGSEIKAIIADTRISREINWDYWKDYFSYGHTLRDDTPLQEIYSLPNASILEYSKRNIKIKKYWDYERIKINHERTEKETIDEGVEVLKNVFLRQTRNIKECNVLLSGGYDSRCIAAAIRKYTDVKINAYTTPKKNVGKDTFKDEDARYAKLIAKKLKLNHKIVPAEKKYYQKYLKKFIEEQEAMGFENMWMMPLINIIDSRYKNFDGIAGDVFLKAGYLSKPAFSYSMDMTNRKMIKRIDNKRLSYILDYYLKERSLIKTEKIIQYFNLDVQKKISPDLKRLYEAAKDIKRQENGIKIFQAERRTKNLICMQPSNLIIRKTYSRMPFLDNEFVEFAFSIPPEMKIKKDIYREILKKSFPETMNIPTTNDSKGVKSYIKNFLIKNDLKFIRYSIGVLCNILKPFKKKVNKHKKLSSNPHDVDYLIKLAKKMDIPDFIDREKLIKDIDYHVNNDIDPTYFLEPIMHFCIWHDKFYINKKTSVSRRN